jgi:FKBP-type peptidyl-prolyl cis-trans isomerase
VKVGGGAQPKKGDFVGAQFVVKVREEVLLDTKTTGRPIAFTFGKRPYLSVNCEGVEEGLSGMRRGGVRELTVPPSLAYGGRSRELPNGALVPPDATVTFLITLEDVTGSYL